MSTVSKVKYCYLVLLLTTAIAGCAGKAVVDQPANIALRLRADAALNPDINGRPSPIVVKVYVLTAAPAFNNARFFELYENDVAILGDDLIDVKEFEVSPGDTVDVDAAALTLPARHIGVLAAYRDMDHATWRGMVDVLPNERSLIEIRLGAIGVAVDKVAR